MTIEEITHKPSAANGLMRKIEKEGIGFGFRSFEEIEADIKDGVIVPHVEMFIYANEPVGEIVNQYIFRGMLRDALAEEIQEAIKGPMKSGDHWDEDGRCKHCGAGDDNNHSYTCPTGLTHDNPDHKGPLNNQ